MHRWVLDNKRKEQLAADIYSRDVCIEGKQVACRMQAFEFDLGATAGNACACQSVHSLALLINVMCRHQDIQWLVEQSLRGVSENALRRLIYQYDLSHGVDNDDPIHRGLDDGKK
nr:hypothetical protein [Noviherbaspirillum sp. Root189]